MIKPRPELQTDDSVSAFVVRWDSALEDPLIDIDVPFDPYSILSKDVQRLVFFILVLSIFVVVRTLSRFLGEPLTSYGICIFDIRKDSKDHECISSTGIIADFGDDENILFDDLCIGHVF